MTNPDLAALSEAATQAMNDALVLADADANPDQILVARCKSAAAHDRLAYALVNAYRSGDLVLIDREGMRDKSATSIHGVLSRANVTAYLDMPVETAGWCADAAIAAILGEE